MKQSIYNLIAIAGTFDRLHKGHKYFIRQAFRLGYKVIIGLTSDKYVQGKLKVKSEKLKVKVNNYIEREKELRGFLKQEDLLERAEIVEIDDVYGPTAGETKIEALVVTKETLGGARLVNKKRKYKGLKSLKILQIPLILADDHKRIASTRIRLGEIDRLGKVFLVHILSDRYKFKPISKELRKELKEPLGLLLNGNPQNLTEIVPKLKEKLSKIEPVMIITVGDEATLICNEIGIIINLAIFDYKVRRKTKYSSLLDLGFRSTFSRGPLANGVRTVKNPAGHITKSLVEAVRKSFLKFIKDGRQKIIRVIGEEDLAGVPAILLSPLGSIVLYGQPGEGVVIVEVTEKKKQDLMKLLDLS